MQEVKSHACVVGGAAVVGGREERDEVALRKALKAVHHALVRAHYHLQVVHLQQQAPHVLPSDCCSRMSDILNAFSGAVVSQSRRLPRVMRQIIAVDSSEICCSGI